MQGMAAMHTHLPYSPQYALRTEAAAPERSEFSEALSSFLQQMASCLRERHLWFAPGEISLCSRRKIVFARYCLHNKFMDPLQTSQHLQETTNERKSGSFHLVQIQ